MASRSRKRVIRYGGWPCGTLNGSPRSEPAYMGTHSCDDELHPGPPYHSGGPLSISKRKFSIDRTADISVRYNLAPVQSYYGHLCCTAYVPSPEPTPRSLSGWGAIGWNRTFPVHPIYNLGVSLAEIKDLPRMLTQTWEFFKSIRSIKFSRYARTSVGEFLGSTVKGVREASGDYLNLQFGWVPFLQDLAFLTDMQRKLARKMAWLKKHNGKSIRRKVTLDASSFSEKIDRTIVPFTSMSPVLPTQLYSGSVVSTDYLPITKTYSGRIWYSAKYRLYIPELTNFSTKALQFSLVGLDLDPSIIYRATPWSWLLDWFLNVGTVLQNIYLRARFHVVAEYAYVMGSEDYRYDAPGYCDVNTGVFSWNGSAFVWSGKPRRLSGASQTTYEFRKREEANPYGFGFTFKGLSAYQWSILAALGLTGRGRSLATRA